MAEINFEKMAEGVMKSLRQKGLFVSRWIPVEEGLPKKNGDYLVTVPSICGGGSVYKYSFATDLHKVDKYDFPKHKSGFYRIDSEWGYYEVDDVIAWMPLPEPYKAESENEK